MGRVYNTGILESHRFWYALEKPFIRVYESFFLGDPAGVLAEKKGNVKIK